MVVLEKEVDFPRGHAAPHVSSTGETVTTKVPKATKRKAADEDRLFGDGTKVKKDVEEKVSKKDAAAKVEEEKVWKKIITMDLLTESVMGCGVVREIHEDQIFLETADSCRVTLPATQIGKGFTQLLKGEKISLDSAFCIGQMVPFRVTKAMVARGGKKTIFPIVTCDPNKLNAHLTPARLVSGLVIHSLVESIEEKGAILDIGLQSVKGFLPIEKQPAKGIVVGQPLIVRVESQASRIVKVTSFVEQDNLSVDACENLALNHLMPGTIIDCDPEENQKVGINGGMVVKLGNGLRGFVSRRNLPPRLRTDGVRLGRALRCVVLICQQNSKMLVLSAHPDIVAVSKPEKRAHFDGYDIGDKITCSVTFTNPDKFMVGFSLPPTADGKTPLVTAISSKAYLKNAAQIASYYKIGSAHECRVMDVRLVDRSLIVATSKTLLEQKIVSYKDAVPGDIVKAKVTKSNTKGIAVTAYDLVKGFIPMPQAFDKPTGGDIDKDFPVDKMVNCRVLYADHERKQLILTARPTLVSGNNVRISSYDESLVGQVTTGTVVRILPAGGFLVSFFNSVKGLVHASEAKRLGPQLRLNQLVEVRVLSVDPSDNKMILGLADESLRSVSNVVKPQHVDATLMDGRQYSGVVSSIIEMGSGGRRSEKAQIDIQKEGKTLISASLTPAMASDALDAPFESFRDTIGKDVKIDKLALLGTLSGANSVTAKRFICDWIADESHVVPKTFAELKTKQVVCGIISQRIDNGSLFMEIAGGSGLVGRVVANPYVAEGEVGVQVGQTVLAIVGVVNNEKKTFVVSVKPCVPEGSDGTDVALSLLRSCVSEQLWFAANTASGPLPIPGSIVKVTVSHIVDEILFVKFNEKLTGCIRKGNYAEGVKANDKIECMVIDYRFPSNDAELVQITSANKKAKGKKAVAAVAPTDDSRVVLLRRDYIAVLEAGSKLCFVPNRFHPNVVPASASKTARVSLGSIVKLVSTSSLDSVSIGLLEGDVELVKKLVSVSLSSDKKKTFPGKAISKKSTGAGEDNDSDSGDESEDDVEEVKGKKCVIPRVKNFTIYTGTVGGKWQLNGGSELSAIVVLPSGCLGRLHISELPAEYLKMENAMPEFLKKYKHKNVNVKVIGHATVSDNDKKKIGKKTRVFELTMNEEKMQFTKLRAKALQYQNKFKTGDIVRCFAVPESMKEKQVRVEINPLTVGIVPKECLSDDLLMSNPDGGDKELLDFMLHPGEMRSAVVQAYAKRRHGILELTLRLLNKETQVSSASTNTAVKKSFNIGHKIPGRVTKVNHANLSVEVHLPGGIRAMITPTAISNKYEKVHQHISKFHEDEVFHLVALRCDEHPRKFYVVTEGRFDSYLKNGNDGDAEQPEDEEAEIEKPAGKNKKQKTSNPSESPLFANLNEVKAAVGTMVNGFVLSTSSKNTWVEIAPGLHGRLVKEDNKPELMRCPVNTVVRVKILPYEDGIKLALDSIIFTPSIDVKSARKRTASQSEAEQNVQKTMKLEEAVVEAGEKAVVSDPGFDWSNSGFQPQDLAAVGKLVDEDNKDTKESAKTKKGAKKESTAAVVTAASKSKEEKERIKAMTKEERLLEKERMLSAREAVLAGETESLPQNDDDFALLLKKDPNSADVWIKYISFFLGKSDIPSARATAERALTLINYREQAELLNVWFAYLNMEVAFGDASTTKVVFDRACNSADSLKIHKQMAAIYVNNGKSEEANEIFEAMIRKFRASSDDVWLLYAEHLMSTEREQKARDLLQRALLSVPKHRHTQLISRFAQLEYRKGDAEKGRTMFEGLVTAYPKKTDIWTVYSDLALKHTGIEAARQILERACALDVNIHKLRPLFKRWMEAEEKHGDEQSQQLVRSKAERYLQAQDQNEEE